MIVSDFKRGKENGKVLTADLAYAVREFNKALTVVKATMDEAEEILEMANKVAGTSTECAHLPGNNEELDKLLNDYKKLWN